MFLKQICLKVAAKIKTLICRGAGMQKLMNDRCLFETRFADGTEGPNVFLDVLASPHTG